MRFILLSSFRSRATSSHPRSVSLFSRSDFLQHACLVAGVWVGRIQAALILGGVATLEGSRLRGPEN